MSRFDMSSIPWSKPTITKTKGGARRQVRTWFIPWESAFWELWNDPTSTLEQQGYSVSLWQGRWMLTEWRPVGGGPSPAMERAVQAAEAQERINGQNANADPDLPPMMQARFQEVCEIYHQIEEETGENYRYQFPSIKRLALAVEAGGGALDASDTGTGKTAVACAVARTLGRKILVVCPKSVIPPWSKFVQMFGLEPAIINYEMLRTGRTEFGSWGKSKQFLWNSAVFDPDDWLFVFDECHRLKDYRTKQCALGVCALTLHYRTIGLSATAADNPLHMKFTSLLTGLIDHPSHYWGWMMSNGVRQGKWGLEFVGGHKVIQKLHRQIFPARGSRIRIADLGDIFPETRISADPYDLGDITHAQAQTLGIKMGNAAVAIDEAYRTMRQEIRKLEEAKAHDWQANVLTAILRARQETELLKVPTLVSMAEDGLEEGSSVVIILNFQNSVDGCGRLLKCTNLITGQREDVKRRQERIDAFNADDEHLLIMNIKAGGLGISLHGTRHGRPRLVLISPTFSGQDLKQALGRAHRAGGAFSIQRIIFASGTVEEEACRKVRAKIKRIEILNDGELDAALAF